MTVGFVSCLSQDHHAPCLSLTDLSFSLLLCTQLDPLILCLLKPTGLQKLAFSNTRDFAQKDRPKSAENWAKAMK